MFRSVFNEDIDHIFFTILSSLVGLMNTKC